MSEAGVDISNHRSRRVDELRDVESDCAITVCDHAGENCPSLPGNAEVIHRGLEDPPKLGQNTRSQEEGLVHYRRVRDEVREFVARS